MVINLVHAGKIQKTLNAFSLKCIWSTGIYNHLDFIDPFLSEFALTCKNLLIDVKYFYII